MGNRVDKALQQLSNLFHKSGKKKLVKWCDTLRDDEDEQKVIAMLYGKLRELEDSSEMQWSARQSAAILVSAGLAHPEDADKGAYALMKLIKEAQ